MNQISRTVSERLNEPKVDGGEVVFDLNMLRVSMPAGVLGVITGSPSPDFEPGLKNIQQLQRSQALTTANLMMSVIGAAVTRWALRPDPLEGMLGVAYEMLLAEIQKRKYHLDLSLVTSSDKSAVDDNGASAVAEDACKRLLRMHVEPKIPKKAASMAQELDKFLSALTPLPRSSSAVEFRPLGYGIDSKRKIEFREPQWAKDWQKELAGIFVKALELRVSLRKNPSGTYTFEFPTPMQAVTLDSEGAQMHCPVLIGLFPSVHGQFQPIRGGPGTERECLYGGAADVVQAAGIAARHPRLATGHGGQADDTQVVPGTPDRIRPIASEEESEPSVSGEPFDGTFTLTAPKKTTALGKRKR